MRHAYSKQRRPNGALEAEPAWRTKEMHLKILIVLTSHDQLGNTGRKTGFWLEEFAAPYGGFQFRSLGAHGVGDEF